MTWLPKTMTTAALSLLLLVGGYGCIPASETMGTLSVQLTDSPFPTELVSEANVTIFKLEAREAGGDGGSPYVTLSEDSQTFNLLNLRNGVTATLVEIELPAGSYDLFRIYVTEGLIIMKDGTAYALTIPSGEQTGIKLFVSPAIEVIDGLTSDLLLDFDVDKSFVAKGQGDSISGFNFKPVIRASNSSTVGRIVGSVADAATAAIANAIVWVTQDTVVSSTFTDTAGKYALLGLPAGNYMASATAAGYDTVSVSADVAAGSQTAADFELTPQ